MDSSRKKTDYAPAFDPELCSVRESRALLWSQRNCGSLTRDASTTCLPDGATTRYYGSAILVMHCEWVIIISARIVARMHSKRARPTRSTSNDRALREYKSHLLRLKQLCPPNARSSAVAERPRVIRVVNDFAKSPKVVKGHWHCCRSIHDKI